MNAKFLQALFELTEDQLRTIAFQLAAESPDRFEQLVTGGRLKATYSIKYTDGGYGTVEVAEGIVEDLENYQSNEKVHAIKYLRHRAGLGLLEAKLLVEQHVKKFQQKQYDGFVERKELI